MVGSHAVILRKTPSSASTVGNPIQCHLVGGNHFVDDAGDPRHTLSERDECLALCRRAVEAPEMNLAIHNNDIAATELRPRFAAKRDCSSWRIVRLWSNFSVGSSLAEASA
jgi:hypothetical protein